METWKRRGIRNADWLTDDQCVTTLSVFIQRRNAILPIVSRHSVDADLKMSQKKKKNVPRPPVPPPPLPVLSPVMPAVLLPPGSTPPGPTPPVPSPPVLSPPDSPPPVLVPPPPAPPTVQRVACNKPQKRSAEEDLPSTSPVELIGYVHEVSPTKSNRTNTVEYFDVLLQTEKRPSQRAVCFTKSKRQLFVDRQKTNTPVKLTNFSMSTNGADILINNMTRVSRAEHGEYSFQITLPPKQHVFISLKDVAESRKQFDIVNIKGKVTKMNKTKVVGKKKLNLAEATLSDGSMSIKLDLWQNHISLVEVGKIYSFTKLRVKEWNNIVNLSTNQDSNITLLPEEEQGDLSSVKIDENEMDTCATEFSSPAVKVTCVNSIENIERFIQCANSNCRKKIKQDSGKSIVTCDLCGHTMNRSRCKKNIFVSVMVYL